MRWVPGCRSFANYHEGIEAVVIQFYSAIDPDLYNWNLSEIVHSRIAKTIERTKDKRKGRFARIARVVTRPLHIAFIRLEWATGASKKV